MKGAIALALVVLAALMGVGTSAAITLDFESLADLESVTVQFPGFTFSNTTALASGTVGGSLNELEFPPLSGVIVVFDDGGTMSIAFSFPVGVVSGFVTYLSPVTLTAFDAAMGLVATDSSDFMSNLALSGDPGSAPNELMQVAYAGGIALVTFSGDFAGGSFTLDNLAAVPAPASAVLVGAGLVLVAIQLRRLTTKTTPAPRSR